jgi:hypothetical protein
MMHKKVSKMWKFLAEKFFNMHVDKWRVSESRSLPISLIVSSACRTSICSQRNGVKTIYTNLCFILLVQKCNGTTDGLGYLEVCVDCSYKSPTSMQIHCKQASSPLEDNTNKLATATQSNVCPLPNVLSSHVIWIINNPKEWHRLFSIYCIQYSSEYSPDALL